MQGVRDIYHNRGYIYAYTNQVVIDREGADHVVDVAVDVFEGDRFRLGRLEFSGNTRTNEKVLRREFRVAEGDWMSMGVFRSSVFKVNALGYWKLEEEPLEFDFDDEAKRVNVTVKGKEVGRNDIQFGAGYSELDGFFAQAMFNTRNFLGRGETLGRLGPGRRQGRLLQPVLHRALLPRPPHPARRRHLQEQHRRRRLLPRDDRRERQLRPRPRPVHVVLVAARLRGCVLEVRHHPDRLPRRSHRRT